MYDSTGILQNLAMQLKQSKTKLPRYRKFDWLYLVNIANQIDFCLYCLLQELRNLL